MYVRTHTHTRIHISMSMCIYIELYTYIYIYVFSSHRFVAVDPNTALAEPKREHLAPANLLGTKAPPEPSLLTAQQRRDTQFRS